MRFEQVAGLVTFAVVLAGVVFGFATIGPPQHMRLVELDGRRLDDLRSLAFDVRTGARMTGAERLPERLIGTDDANQHRRDPQTGVPYEYHRESARRYRLCATFALPADAERVEARWRHGAGRTCYRFDVNRDVEPLAPAS